MTPPTAASDADPAAVPGTATDWPAVHDRVLAAFQAGWARPGPHAWDEFLAEDVELLQPMLRQGRGRRLWWDEVRRLLAFLPDFRGEVLSWSGRAETLFIEVGFTATLGGRPLSFRAVDRLLLSPEGILLRRDSHFDPTTVAAVVARRPSAWLPWWRSGIGPLLVRRRLPGIR
jgi:hypothetical protein